MRGYISKIFERRFKNKINHPPFERLSSIPKITVIEEMEVSPKLIVYEEGSFRLKIIGLLFLKGSAYKRLRSTILNELNRFRSSKRRIDFHRFVFVTPADIFVCVCWCLAKCAFWRKFLPHSGQEKGFSPV